MRKTIVIYACILEFDRFEPDEFSELYTPSREKSLEGIRSARAKTQSAAAELAYLAAARAAYEGGLFGAANEEKSGKRAFSELKKRFSYSYSENGQPMLDGAFMSLSHTSGAALAVVSPLPVGADIERERRISERVAKRIMNPAEFAEFSALSEEEKNARAIECWTAKESFLKLTGEGISAGLGKLDYDRMKGRISREKTGERAEIIRLDSRISADKEAESELSRTMAGEGLFACVCLMGAAEIRLLRFTSAREAAEFILGA